MAFTFEESNDLEVLKKDHKLELIDAAAADRLIEHEQKKERLTMMLEIAKAGGVNRTE